MISILNQETFSEISLENYKLKLHKSNIKFVTFGQTIPFIETKGYISIPIYYENKERKCDFHVTDTKILLKFLNGIPHCFVIEYFKISKESIKTVLSVN